MKKTIKTLLSFVIIIALALSVFALNVSAATATISGAGEYEVGKSFNVKIQFNADATLYAVEVDVTYNSSVLKLNSVSGADYSTGNGSVKIVDDGFSATKPSKTSSYTLNFTAIAAGNSNITASILGGGEAESKASTSAKVSVVTPKPSSNANLASIKLSSGSLSPAFNPNTTDYNVTVKYDVDSITITGAVADGKATYIGGGTFALEVGDNKKTLTVTAEDGTKKSYTINIKRMTEQETKDAEQAERDANPLLVIIDGVDYTIVNDLESVNIPAGFTLGKSTRKDTEITVLNDDCGEYQLYYLTDTEGNGAFYTRDENDKFTRISYINANGKFYIIEEIDVLDTLPTGYVVANRVVDGIDVKVYAHNSDELKDLWIIKCYVNGQRAYYQFDSAEGTVQRALEFDLAVKETENIVDTQQQDSDKKGFGLFGDMNVTGIIVLVGVVFVALLFIVVAVLIIIKIATSGKNDYDDYIIPTDAEFSLNDFAQNVSNDEETTSEEPEANDK